MKTPLLLLAILSIQFTSCANENRDCEVGAMVRTVSHSIKTSTELDSIVKYGTDSRYYVMIRGWLVQELQGVESQFNSSDSIAKIPSEQRVKFLRKAIRRIDLE